MSVRGQGDAQFCFVLFFPLYSTAFLLYKNDLLVLWGALGGAVVKNLTPNTGDLGLIPESGRCPGAGNGNPLQDSCLENPMDGGAWRATVHRVTKSQTRLSPHTRISAAIFKIEE